MNKTVADLALRWLTRNADSLSDAERRVLQSAIDRKPISRDQFQAHAGDQKIGERIAYWNKLREERGE